MEGSKQEDASSPKPQHRGPPWWVHVVTAIFGLIALADLLEKYGPNANEMITHIIDQLWTFSPLEPEPNYSDILSRPRLETELPTGWTWLKEIFVTLIGIKPAVQMLRSGFLGIVMLAASVALAVPCALQLSLQKRNPGYLLAIGPYMAIWGIILKYILIATLSIFGGLLSLVTAFVCMLASIFFGLKMFTAPLEVYHGAHSAKELAKKVKIK